MSIIPDEGLQQHVRYFRAPNGSIGEVIESHPGATGLPEGAIEITEDEYRATLAELDAARAEYVAELLAADTARQREAYEALLAAGIPEQVARHLSGYTADQDPPSDGGA
jgi:hypothetical protein